MQRVFKQKINNVGKNKWDHELISISKKDQIFQKWSKFQKGQTRTFCQGFSKAKWPKIADFVKVY